MKKATQQSGFTLIELAIVLVIIGVLMGGFLLTLSSRIEQSRREATRAQLADIKAALLGFATRYQYLPCPTTPNGGGREQRAAGGCSVQHGFVPGRTLGLPGHYNRDGLLLDSWNNPIRYSISTANGNALVNAGQMRAVGLDALAPDLRICDRASTSGATCAGGAITVAQGLPFVLLSLGQDGSNFVGLINPNTDEGENAAEATAAANAAGENRAYSVAADRVFVLTTYRGDVAAGRFDDMLDWASPFVLYSRMIEAGRLP